MAIHEDDISKRLFMEVLRDALKACDGSVWTLSEKLKLRSHCYGWIKGKMPPYTTMQKMYRKLEKIAGGSDAAK